MIHSRAYLQQTAPLPGRIMAVRADGGTQMSDQIATPTMCVIEELYEADDNQIGVRFRNTHPFETGESQPCRAGGRDGSTTRAHRANNWEGGPLVDPYTCRAVESGGVQLGGDPWTVTRVDDNRLILDGSIWKVDPDDPDSVFIYGEMWREEVDAWPWLDDIQRNFIGDQPGGLIFGPAGSFVLGKGDGTRGSWFPHGDFFLKGTPGSSRIHRADYFNAIPWHFTQSGILVEGIEQRCRRQFQGNSLHGWKVTCEDDGPRNTFHARFINCLTLGASGYGANHGHPGGKPYLFHDRHIVMECNSDGMDVKGPLNDNPFGTYYHGKLRDCGTTEWGLGDVGTNKTLPQTLADNPLITNGTTTVQVVANQKPYAGQMFTFPDDFPEQDGVALAGQSWRAVSTTKIPGPKWLVRFTYPTAATGTTTGGGSGLTVIAPAAFKKPGFDIRGMDMNTEGCWSIGHVMRGMGLRRRGGDGENANGMGGHRSQDVGFKCVDKTPYEWGVTGGRGYVCTANTVAASNLMVVGNGRGTGVVLSATATQALLTGLNVSDVGTAINSGSPNFKIEGVIDGCVNGLYASGADGTLTGSLAFDPITMTEGSSVVTLAWPSSAAGRPGVSGTFELEADILNGIDLNDETWTVTAADADTITFDCGQLPTITGTQSWGEDEVSYVVAYSVTATGEIAIRMTNMLSGGSGINRATQSDVNVHDSTYQGDGTPLTGVGTGPLGPGNVGLPNTQSSTTLAGTGATTVLTAASSGKLYKLPSTASGIDVLTIPAASTLPDDWFIDLMALAGSGSIGIQLDASGTDKINDGASASSAGGTLTSSTAFAGGRLRKVGTGNTAFAFIGKTGTWTAA